MDNINKPYLTALAHLEVWLEWLRTLLGILLELSETGEPFVHRLLPVTTPRNTSSGDDYSEAVLEALDEILIREKRTTEIRLPLRLLREGFNLSVLEQICLLCAAAPSLDRSFEASFAALQNGSRTPTLGLCASLYRLLGLDDFGESAIAAGLSEGLGLLLYIDKTQHTGCLGYTLRAKPIVCHFLSAPEGIYSSDSALIRTLSASAEPDEMVLYPGLSGKLKRFFEGSGGGTLLYLSGARGGGKKHLLLRTAADSGRLLTIYDFEQLSRLPQAEARDAALGFLLECLLRGSLPVIADVTDQSEVQPLVRFVTGTALTVLPCLCVTGESRTPPEGLKRDDRRFLHLSLPRLSTLERRAVWQSFARGVETEADLDPAFYANKFHYTPGQVRQILHHAAAESTLRGSGDVGDSDILAAVTVKNAELTTSGSISPIECIFTWDDLVLAESQKDIMRRLVQRVHFEHVVNGEWGFDRKLPYGRGVSVVVYGPPGTGKTMSAQVIARELGIALYRVDLSRMISKYIGETEKNLSEAFDFASRSGCILFFDEADALFGKRTEVKDSHDKYANVETSYLLQKIEEHEGVSILSTNNLNNIDTAFRRRFTYLINIPAPDAATRLLLWEKAFPAETPLSPGLRFDKLAEKLEFNGSAIKSVAVEAAYRAAAEGIAVEFRHLAEAIKIESLKNTLPMSETDLLDLR